MIRPQVTDPILWRSSSRFNDWIKGDLPRELLESWLRNDLIGVPEAVESDDVVKRFDMGAANHFVDRLLATPIDRRGRLSFRAIGKSPHDWWISVKIPPYDPEVKRNDGFASINLYFPRAAFLGPARSEVLLSAFAKLYTADNCEFACLHPEGNMGRLQMKEYETALTLGPMFAGMFWANFLGPGHVEEFRPEVIDALPVFRRKWLGPNAVLLVASDDLATADSPENERKLVAMTEQLRKGVKS